MPSSMVHLLTAYKYEPNGSVLFWIGNLAPDCVGEWKRKDKTHFRDRDDRAVALYEFALSMDLTDDFNKGILLHLYLDWQWDEQVMKKYVDNYTGENWLKDYRHEIGLVSAWLFHHKEWSRKIWDEMGACPVYRYDLSEDFPAQDISDLIMRNNKWHRENDLEISPVFDSALIERFTDQTAAGFTEWIHSVIKRK